jgi:two-component system OmpR family sensor kinase
MFKSIRWRLQLWYALVLLAVVAGFAAIQYQSVGAARFSELDAELETSALYLDAQLQRFPPRELDGTAPERPHGRPRNSDEEGRDLRPGPPRGRNGPPPLKPPPSLERLREELTLPASGEGRGGRAAEQFFAIWKADGVLLKARGVAADRTAPELSGGSRPGRLRVWQRGEFREAVLTGTHGARILVGRSSQREESELLAFAWQLVGAGVVVLGVGLAGGWWISARILQPVATIAATASAISANNLSQRLDPREVDQELTGLVEVLNAMFERLEAAFERQARLTADASHELRTPLTILRSHAELALARPRSAEEYRDTIETCLRAATRMAGLVEGMLTLARVDAGKLELSHQPLNFQRVIEESVELLRPLATKKNITLTCQLAPLKVSGDAGRLSQVITNLVTNAIKYNQPGGQVEVTLGLTPAGALLSVRDNGCGVPVEDRPHLFERFYRVEKSRVRTSGGNGLGLAICKGIVEAHGGTLGFETELGRGSTFWVQLPCLGSVTGRWSGVQLKGPWTTQTVIGGETQSAEVEPGPSST